MEHFPHRIPFTLHEARFIYDFGPGMLSQPDSKRPEVAEVKTEQQEKPVEAVTNQVEVQKQAIQKINAATKSVDSSKKNTNAANEKIGQMIGAGDAEGTPADYLPGGKFNPHANVESNNATLRVTQNEAKPEGGSGPNSSAETSTDQNPPEAGELAEQKGSPENAEEGADGDPKEKKEQIKQKQERLKQIKDEINDIDIALKDEKIPPDEKKSLESQKAKLQKEQTKIQNELNDLIPPETYGEQLDRTMKSALDDLRNAESGADKFAALMKLLGTIVEYFNRTFNGTLGDKIKKPEEEKKDGTDANKENKNDKQRLQGELADRAVAKKKEGGAELTLEKNIDGSKKEKQEKIVKNKEDITMIDGKVDKMKDSKTKLVDQKGDIEKQMTKIQGDETKASEMTALKMELETVQSQIEALDKGITGLDKQRDDLGEQNKKLEKDVAALDEIKKDVEQGQMKILEVMKVLNEIFPKSGLKLTHEFGADGKLKVKLGPLTEEMRKVAEKMGIQLDADGNVTVDEDTPKPEVKADQKKGEQKEKDESGDIKRNLENRLTDLFGSSPIVRNAAIVERSADGKYMLRIDAGLLAQHFAKEGTGNIQKVLAFITSPIGAAATIASEIMQDRAAKQNIESIKTSFRYLDTQANRLSTDAMTVEQARQFVQALKA